MRLAEDIAVAHATRSGEGWINLLLGGHDHNVVQRASTDDETNPDVAQQGVPPTDAAATDYQGDVRIVKSGTDWRGLSIIRLSVARLPDNSGSILNVKREKLQPSLLPSTLNARSTKADIQ
jgi:2',3'-cyclic-nucleotide 2'-phosphodiesterase (5'-nucleotidase family)